MALREKKDAIKPAEEYAVHFKSSRKQYESKALTELQMRQDTASNAAGTEQIGISKEDRMLAFDATHARMLELADTVGKARDSVRVRSSDRYPSQAMLHILKRFDPNNLGLISFHEFDRGLREVGVHLGEDDLVMLRSVLDTQQDNELAYVHFASIIDDRKTIDIPGIQHALALMRSTKEAAGAKRGSVKPSREYMQQWLQRHGSVGHSTPNVHSGLLTGAEQNTHYALLGNTDTVDASKNRRENTRNATRELVHSLLGHKREEAVAFFREIDPSVSSESNNESTIISFQALIAAARRHGVELNKDQLLAIIRELDPSATGAFSIGEALHFLFPQAKDQLEAEFDASRVASMQQLKHM